MRLRLSLALLLIFCCSGLAKAETFSIYNIGTDELGLLGIDPGGTVLYESFNGCNPPSRGLETCFVELSRGVTVYKSETAPTNFVFDNGKPCAAPDFGSHGVCNGGFEVFQAGDSYGVREIYPGSGPDGVLVLGGSADLLYVNSSGDFVVADGEAEYSYQVVNETPEPSSFALLGTGLLGVIGVARKRFA